VTSARKEEATVTIEVKLLTKDDLELLASGEPDVFDDPILPAVAATFLEDPRHHIAVALDDGEIVGFASAVEYVHPDKPHPELWINEVGVAASHHRRGVGKAILKTLLDRAAKAGCTEAWVLTDRENVPACALYMSSGGVEPPGDVVMYAFDLVGREPSEGS
jgi:ribosomal protein S18 acetylase RimI-like enzyme